MSDANATLVRLKRCVPGLPSQGVKPSPTYFSMAQIRPLASSCLFASGVVVAVRTSSPSA